MMIDESSIKEYPRGRWPLSHTYLHLKEPDQLNTITEKEEVKDIGQLIHLVFLFFFYIVFWHVFT